MTDDDRAGDHVGVQLFAARRPSLTAQAVTLVRARELTRPASRRIVSDELAPLFLTRPERALASLPGSLRWPGQDGSTSILCRHRYLDDALVGALPAVRQVLLLGAGYDSRAYRLGLSGRPVFELDQPAISRRKAAIVAAHPGAFATGHPVRVETDFAADRWADDLLAAGVQQGAPTFVVWEGVAMYLRRDAVAATLQTLRRLCGPGSVLGMDLIGLGSALGAAALGAVAQSLRLIGEPVRFALPPARAAGFLGECGWDVTELLESDAMSRLATDGRRCTPGLYVLSAVPG